MKMIQSLLFVAGLASLTACSQQENTKEESLEASMEYSEREEEATDAELEYDAAFARSMAERNLLQIRLGELAQAKATIKEVQDLSEKMVNEHRQAYQELKAWASSKGFLLPDELDKKSQLIYDELTEEKGNDFDKSYSNYLVIDHKEEIRKMERQAEKGKDPELKKWATEKIPVWQKHLEMAAQAENTADAKD